MRKKLVFLVVAAATCWLANVPQAVGQNATLEDDLRKQYKTARLGADSSGITVTEPGTVLDIKKGGIRAYPPSDQVILPNTYKDGEVHAPSSMIKKVWNFKDKGQGADNSRLLPAETKVYITRIAVDAKSDKVNLWVIECDSCNGVQQPSSFKAEVSFQFPKGYLQGADAGQVADMVTQVFAPDSGGDAQQQNDGQQGGQDQQQGAQQQAKQPQTIEKGQTEDQVVSILGQPDKIVNLGAKKLYVYKDIKITFVNGKVSDVQ